MSVGELIEFLKEYPKEWEVSVALPKNRIEKVERAEVDPYALDEEGVLLWPESVIL